MDTAARYGEIGAVEENASLLNREPVRHNTLGFAKQGRLHQAQHVQYDSFRDAVEDIDDAGGKSLNRRPRSSMLVCLGTFIDFLDFGVYGALANELADELADFNNKRMAMLFVYTTFALSFFARGIGGTIFGMLGDQYGRSFVLRTSLILMTFCTLFTGLIPTSSVVGVWVSASLLLGLRIIGALSVAPQMNEASIYTFENANDNRRLTEAGKVTVASTTAVSCSLLLVSGMKYGLSNRQMESWGWRVPFILAGLLSSVGAWLQWDMMDSAEYLESKLIHGADVSIKANSGEEDEEKNKEEEEESENKSIYEKIIHHAYESKLILLGCCGVSVSYFSVVIWFPQYFHDSSDGALSMGQTLLYSGLIQLVISPLSFAVPAFLESEWMSCTRPTEYRLLAFSCIATSVALLISGYLVNDSSMLFGYDKDDGPNQNQWMYIYGICNFIILIPIYSYWGLVFGLMNDLVSTVQDRSTVIVTVYSWNVSVFTGLSLFFNEYFVNNGSTHKFFYLMLIWAVCLSVSACAWFYHATHSAIAKAEDLAPV